jgi:predicted transcriptional regulator
MMPPKRTKNQLILEILEICLEDSKSKTRVVYQANMNFNTVNSYLDLLIKNGLIEVIEGEMTLYKTTEKGENALEKLRKIEALVS